MARTFKTAVRMTQTPRTATRTTAGQRPIPAIPPGRAGTTSRPPPMVRQDPAGRARVDATTSTRAGYNSLAHQYGSKVILTQGYLRSELLMGTASNLVFQITDTQQQQNSEMRLSQNDAFWVTHIGLFIGRVASTAVGPHGAMVLHSFPNDKVFGAVAAEQLAIQAMYAGHLTVQVNDITYIDSLDTLSFLRADTAQSGQALSTVATTGITGYSAWEQDRAFKALTPWVLFNGPAKNVISVQLPESLTMGAVAPAQNWAVLICRGYLAQNGGQYRF